MNDLINIVYININYNMTKDITYTLHNLININSLCWYKKNLLACLKKLESNYSSKKKVRRLILEN